ncbi:MAG TPA: regulatory protein RecX [Dongiaceae bacterium]|nr:regulatory protein RecX [Dongiaceae bacterium]
MTDTADLTHLEAAREAALKLLERTRRTRSDLARRLRDRDFDTATIDAVLARLAGVGLVDDVEYARAYLAERWGRRAAGWRRLEADLRRKGLEPADIAAARERLEQETGGADEVTLARRVLAQGARRLARLDPRVRRRRSWALLARRGFDPDVIEQALREVPETGEQ